MVDAIPIFQRTIFPDCACIDTKKALDFSGASNLET